MVVRILIFLIGMIHIANGAWMLAAPDAWYAAIPGVEMTGPNNHHFVRDIGLAFVASGAGMILALRASMIGAAFTLAGAIWPLLHAGLHVWGWMEHGFPAAPGTAVAEVVGVVMIGMLGFALAFVNARKQGIV